MSDMPDGTPDRPIDPTAIDLAPELQWEILGLMERMGSSDPREVLGVPTAATVDDAKAAYFTLARRFHPDQFFRKRLGTFQAKVEYVFTHLTRAFQEVLRNPEGPPPRAEPAKATAPLLAWSPDDLPELSETPAEGPAAPQIGGRPRERFAKALQQQRFDLATEAIAALEVEEPHSLDIPKLRHELNRRQGEVGAQAEYQKGAVAHQNGEWTEAVRHSFRRPRRSIPATRSTSSGRRGRCCSRATSRKPNALRNGLSSSSPTTPTAARRWGTSFSSPEWSAMPSANTKPRSSWIPSRTFARTQMRKLWWKG